MFDYTIYPDNDIGEFKKACTTIEGNISGLLKKEILIDVDGSLIQVYTKNEKRISVFDDYEVGAVYVKSEIEILGIVDYWQKNTRSGN